LPASDQRQTLKRLRNHVVPLIGRKRIGDLRPKDVEQLARDIAAHKTNKDEKTGFRTRIIVRGGEGAARKVFATIANGWWDPQALAAFPMARPAAQPAPAVWKSMSSLFRRLA